MLPLALLKKVQRIIRQPTLYGIRELEKGPYLREKVVCLIT